MPLFECLERVPYREYLIWKAHFEQELNEPSRSDYYLMQVAQKVVEVHQTSKSSVIPIEDYKIPIRLRRVLENQPPANQNNNSNFRNGSVEAIWMARVGYKPSNN